MWKFSWWSRSVVFNGCDEVIGRDQFIEIADDWLEDNASRTLLAGGDVTDDVDQMADEHRASAVDIDAGHRGWEHTLHDIRELPAVVDLGNDDMLLAHGGFELVPGQGHDHPRGDEADVDALFGEDVNRLDRDTGG
ncbi:MAG: hypothetical protein EBT47_05875 [Chloroflexi bacterium]|nr:hypothetical protein [Chloroflexota bacterium]